jgi:hypothetical protein
LNYWGWNVTYNNTQLNFSNYSVAAGGVITYSFDINHSNATGNITVVAWWFRNNTQECYYSAVFVISNVTGQTGLFGTLASLKDDTGIGDNALRILVLIVVTVMVVFASRYTTAGGAVIGVVSLAFFTFVTGWLPDYAFGILTLIGMAWAYFAYKRGF